MMTWIRWIPFLLLVLGLWLLFVVLPLGVVLIVLGLALLILITPKRGRAGVRWRALADLEAAVGERIVEKAKDFAGMKTVESVLYPRVTASHTRVVNVLGIDGNNAEVLVGIDPVTTEVVKMVTLCPRAETEATEVTLSQERAESQCQEFLKKKGLSLPEDYVLDEARVNSVGPWKRWRFVWRHLVQDGIRMLPDFVTMEVNATEEGNVISYSKVDHRIEVDLTPRLNVEDAVRRAAESIPLVEELDLAESKLAVAYPNHFFRRHVWEWSDDQALCWILKFHREGKHAIDIWVDAVTGGIHGGQLCHLHAPEVFGVDATGDNHMQSHLNNIWSPYLDMMKFDVGSFEWTNAAAGVTEATITNAIANGRYFIVEGHGDTTATAEMMSIAYQGTADERAFTPDEVPANNLRFVFLDTCQSGEDGTGDDFKDTFIDEGADVFIGFDDYMCAWDYEESLLHYLAQGNALANAHYLADAEVSPWYSIVITYDVACLNKVRLAPIQVDVNDSTSGDVVKNRTFTVTATINNREDVDHTAAENVKAELVLPPGFSVMSGANPQDLGVVNWNSPEVSSWTVRAPNTTGFYDLDVEVWSDNLGVAVDDPNDPFHKFSLDVLTFWQMLIRKVFGSFAWFAS